jgi:hypothetical protein
MKKWKNLKRSTRSKYNLPSLGSKIFMHPTFVEKRAGVHWEGGRAMGRGGWDGGEEVHEK